MKLSIFALLFSLSLYQAQAHEHNIYTDIKEASSIEAFLKDIGEMKSKVVKKLKDQNICFSQEGKELSLKNKLQSCHINNLRVKAVIGRILIDTFQAQNLTAGIITELELKDKGKKTCLTEEVQEKSLNDSIEFCNINLTEFEATLADHFIKEFAPNQ